MSYEFILTRTEGRVGIAQFNRPKAYNALSPELMQELMHSLETFDADDDIGCIIVTGSEKVFSAGADIKYMARAAAPADMLNSPLIGQWDRLAKISKPVIAAVSGFALGGGCELAMTCDMIVASESARFGQPEIKLGVAPGMGGSQRLTRAIGKSKSMEMCLTGRMMSAEEAERSNLIVRVVPQADLIADVLKTAATIAAMPPMATIANKEMVNSAFEMTLDQGLIVERRIFQILTASEDKKEGMAAFIEKREGQWKGR